MMAETPPETPPETPKTPLLHGTLFATISKVDNIHYGDVGYLSWKGVSTFLKNRRWGKGNLKIYVTVSLDKWVVGQTRLLEEQKNPVWDESFQAYCAHSASYVIFTLKETNFNGEISIGTARIPVTDLLNGETNPRCPIYVLDIVYEHNNAVMADSKIHVELQFIPATDDANWGRGIQSADYGGVPHTFFPQRQGCGVLLYQDAHVPDNFQPEIQLQNGTNYEQHTCWKDIVKAITEAKHFIYISGWSVVPEIYLKRGPNGDRKEGEKLGELLKKKADVDTVKVLMLVWDPSSLLGYAGIMETHARKTNKYFKGSKVKCILCRRKIGDSGSSFEKLKTSIMFSHHQKLLVVDSELPNGDSHVVSFVGGLDLCKGRYDTPDHPLFGTLDTDHKDDFHQPNFASDITKGGPREPWHDIHSRLEGAIAWDVLTNFEQRWRKEGGDETLLSTPQSCNMPRENRVGDTESWNVQLFRSIDSCSTFGFPEKPEEAVYSGRGIVSGKHSRIERSIQDAYIHAIRRAKNFIYIENQYFFGSSFGWESDGSDNALHLIPKELLLKIVSKINAGERFTVYVVVPMWPEGLLPFIQETLDYQRRTMEMMYKDIIQALKDRKLEEKDSKLEDDGPRDKLEDIAREYLTFFCLGNRELENDNKFKPPIPPALDTHYQKAQKARRFMIYVHSKMIIVDDEYIIVGSANINQRSMDGARDTEIAMGAYQPSHIATETPARGQVHGFRMSLWHEHLGKRDDDANCFQDPASRECIRKVNKIAKRNWELFTNKMYDYQFLLQGHLLPYPVDVNEEGIVTKLPHYKHFPDTNVQIVQGARVRIVPPRIVTR